MNVWQKLCATGLLPEGQVLLTNFSQKFNGSTDAPHSKTDLRPEGHFLLANFSQKFDQKLCAIRLRLRAGESENPARRAVFTRFFVKKSCEKIGLYPKTPDKRNKEPPDYDIRSRTRICLFTDQPLIKFMNFGFYRCQIPAAPDDI